MGDDDDDVVRRPGASGDDEDGIRVYLEELGRIAPLSDGERARLLERAIERAGDAQQRLVEAHLSVVVPIAREYLGRRLGLVDLIQAGNVGLVLAATRLSALEPGTSFEDFAGPIVRSAIEERAGPPTA